MDPYSRNGSFIGQKMDFGTTDRYNTAVYVGGAVFTSAGTTANLTYSLTSLTGGIGTVAAPTDLVIAVWSQATQVAPGQPIAGAYKLSGFTEIGNWYGNAGYGVWILAGRAWGATSITITGGTADPAHAGALAIHVWRNIDPTTPVNNLVTGSRASALPDPPAITTINSNSVVIVAGGSGHDRGAATFGSVTASNFRAIGADSTRDTTVGIGSYFIAAPSTYDPPAWTFSSTDSASYSAVYTSIALNSRNDGNYKNSGIWDMPTVYNTKINEPKNYESIYGTPTYTITTIPSTGTGIVGGTNDLLVAIDTTITSSNAGILIDLGGNGGAGFAMGVLNGNMRVRVYASSAGDWGTAISSTTTAAIEVNISAYLNTACTFYAVADISTRVLKLYVKVGGKLSSNYPVLLGTASAPDSTSSPYGSDGKGYGTINASVADLGTGYNLAFTGAISEIRYWAETPSLDVSGFGIVYQ